MSQLFNQFLLQCNYFHQSFCIPNGTEGAPTGIMYQLPPWTILFVQGSTAQNRISRVSFFRCDLMLFAICSYFNYWAQMSNLWFGFLYIFRICISSYILFYAILYIFLNIFLHTITCIICVFYFCSIRTAWKLILNFLPPPIPHPYKAPESFCRETKSLGG